MRIKVDSKRSLYSNHGSPAITDTALRPLLSTPDPLDTHFLLTIVAKRKVKLLTLTKVYAELIVSLLKLKFLSGFDPLALLPSTEPHLKPTDLILNIGAHVSFVVCDVVLPNVEIGSGGA